MGAAAGKGFHPKSRKNKSNQEKNGVELFQDAEEDGISSSEGGFSPNLFQRTLNPTGGLGNSSMKPLDANPITRIDPSDREDIIDLTVTQPVPSVPNNTNGNTNPVGEGDEDETTSLLSYGDDETFAPEQAELAIIEDVLEEDKFEATDDPSSRPQSSRSRQIPVSTGGFSDVQSSVSPLAQSHNNYSFNLTSQSHLSVGSGMKSLMKDSYDVLSDLETMQISTPLKMTPNSSQNMISLPSKGSAGYYPSTGELIDQKNASLLGLQRQKIWSYAQNAQLEREVEVLKRQLAQFDEAFESKESSNKKKSSMEIQAANSDENISDDETSSPTSLYGGRYKKNNHIPTRNIRRNGPAEEMKRNISNIRSKAHNHSRIRNINRSMTNNTINSDEGDHDSCDSSSDIINEKKEISGGIAMDLNSISNPKGIFRRNHSTTNPPDGRTTVTSIPEYRPMRQGRHMKTTDSNDSSDSDDQDNKIHPLPLKLPIRSTSPIQVTENDTSLSKDQRKMSKIVEDLSMLSVSGISTAKTSSNLNHLQVPHPPSMISAPSVNKRSEQNRNMLRRLNGR